jgi:hypothetical protein
MDLDVAMLPRNYTLVPKAGSPAAFFGPIRKSGSRTAKGATHQGPIGHWRLGRFGIGQVVRALGKAGTFA